MVEAHNICNRPPLASLMTRCSELLQPRAYSMHLRHHVCSACLCILCPDPFTIKFGNSNIDQQQQTALAPCGSLRLELAVRPQPHIVRKPIASFDRSANYQARARPRCIAMGLRMRTLGMSWDCAQVLMRPHHGHAECALGNAHGPCGMAHPHQNCS